MPSVQFVIKTRSRGGRLGILAPAVTLGRFDLTSLSSVVSIEEGV
jgi:hypothetical protein